MSLLISINLEMCRFSLRGEPTFERVKKGLNHCFDVFMVPGAENPELSESAIRFWKFVLLFAPEP